MFNPFPPTRLWIEVALALLILLPHTVVAVMGRPEWTGMALAVQFAILAIMLTRVVIITAKAPNILAVLVMSVIFLAVAGLGNGIARLTRRWIWKRNTHTA